MGTYATIEQIRDSSPNIPAIVRGTDGDLTRWAHEAFVTINAHCRMSFAFEQQTRLSADLGAYADVYLPKVVSGDVSVNRVVSGTSTVVSSDDLELSSGSFLLRYNGSRPTGMGVRPSILEITADWGFAPSREYLLVAAANDLKTRFDLHRVSTDSHLAADTDNEVTSANATDLASVLVLLNELRDLLNVHTASSTFHKTSDSPLLVQVDATDEDSAIDLAVALKQYYNDHVNSTLLHNAVDPLTTGLSVNNPLLPDEILLAFTKVVGRISIRDNAEDIRYQNAGFDSESFGDGYSYRVSEARAHLITPSEMALLHEYVNEGRVVY